MLPNDVCRCLGNVMAGQDNQPSCPKRDNCQRFLTALDRGMEYGTPVAFSVCTDEALSRFIPVDAGQGVHASQCAGKSCEGTSQGQQGVNGNTVVKNAEAA
jgi:hypothetical protein